MNKSYDILLYDSNGSIIYKGGFSLSDKLTMPQLWQRLASDSRFFIRLSKAVRCELFATDCTIKSPQLLPVAAANNLLESAEVQRQLLSKGITAAQLNVIRLRLEGMSNNEVAEKTHTSIPTVKKHIGNLYDHLRVHSLMQAWKSILQLLA
jgi:DNA-binding NarL/FixJ family response regulator